MPRRIAAVLLLLLWTPFAARAQVWRTGSDSRIELMSILFRLAGNQEYRQCRIPAYDQAIETWFAPYREHDAVRLARALGIGFEAPMKLAVYLRDADSLDELAPFDGPAVHLWDRWDQVKAREFLSAARRFAADARFAEFVKSQQALYREADGQLRAALSSGADLGWFRRFFGGPVPAGARIVPGLANGAPSYAARVVDPAGAQEIYAIPGVSKVDAGGLPLFDADWVAVMVHELVHVYAAPAIARAAPPMEKSARQVYGPVAAAMRRQSCGNWQTMLSESLLRAATIEYVMENRGPEAAGRMIRQETAHSFFWMSDLVDLFETYRLDRRQYRTFESFLPRVAEFFDELAPRMGELVDRFQPAVVSSSIPDGGQAVDPAAKSIVVRFSMPMNRLGPGRTAQSAGGQFDASGTVVSIPIALEADRDYEIPLCWAGGQPFVSAEGVPLPERLLRFRTAAGPAPKAK